jgi:predicted DNA-binding antitoxin AbrB/MazE fold protein
MTQEFQAIYQSGVLRPLQPLPLAESEQVTITVRSLRQPSSASSAENDWLDDTILTECPANDDPEISLEKIRREFRSICGSLGDVVIAERGEY